MRLINKSGKGPYVRTYCRCKLTCALNKVKGEAGTYACAIDAPGRAQRPIGGCPGAWGGTGAVVAPVAPSGDCARARHGRMDPVLQVSE